jgi:hypothetical protein
MSRIRTYVAYLLYVIVINRWSSLLLGIETVLFILLLIFTDFIAIVRDLNFTKNVLLSLVAAYLGIKVLFKAFNVARNFIRLFSTRQDLSIEEAKTLLRRGCGEFSFADIQPCGHDQAQRFEPFLPEIQHIQQPIFRSKTLDEMLRSGVDFTLIKNPKKLKNIRRIIRRNNNRYLYILRFHTSKAMNASVKFFNERKFCLSGDFDFHNKTITYHKGTYFDSILTNFLYSKIVMAGFTDDRRVYFDGTVSYPVICTDKGEISLQAQALSQVNNHAGVSTIAFSDDGYMVIYRQGEDTHIDSGFLVASGNGSCDWGDVQSASLLNTVKFSMERELREEGFVKKHHQLETKVTGFFRWIRASGKPQFVGITRMRRIKYDAIRAMEGSKTDLHFDNSVLNRDRLLELVHELLERKDLSIGLMVALMALQECIEQDPDSIYDFLYPFSK